MRTKNFETTEVAIEHVHARFDQWRQTRQKRGAIPDELWSSAVKLAGELGVYKVARSLSLNYASLKKRFNQPSPRIHTEIEASSSFIEIPIMTTGGDAHCRVDIQRTDGNQMQIRLPHGGGAELSALVRAFMG